MPDKFPETRAELRAIIWHEVNAMTAQQAEKIRQYIYGDEAAAPEPKPAPWVPKAGELVWFDTSLHDDDKSCMSGIAEVICTDETPLLPVQAKVPHRDGGTCAQWVSMKTIRPLTDSDWIVNVEGFGKVKAWYIEDGDLYLNSTKYGTRCFIPKLFEFAVVLEWLNKHGVPIKPYEA